ncbi:MAG: hypothetical protein KAQ62_14560, partial [Cyclobacteriaceae bacterium]|nr:hypothetical protein [Cyclobacteriaceae bacterium]
SSIIPRIIRAILLLPFSIRVIASISYLETGLESNFQKEVGLMSRRDLCHSYTGYKSQMELEDEYKETT